MDVVVLGELLLKLWHLEPLASDEYQKLFDAIDRDTDFSKKFMMLRYYQTVLDPSKSQAARRDYLVEAIKEMSDKMGFGWDATTQLAMMHVLLHGGMNNSAEVIREITAKDAKKIADVVVSTNDDVAFLLGYETLRVILLVALENYTSDMDRVAAVTDALKQTEAKEKELSAKLSPNDPYFN